MLLLDFLYVILLKYEDFFFFFYNFLILRNFIGYPLFSIFNILYCKSAIRYDKFIPKTQILKSDLSPSCSCAASFGLTRVGCLRTHRTSMKLW